MTILTQAAIDDIQKRHEIQGRVLAAGYPTYTNEIHTDRNALLLHISELKAKLEAQERKHDLEREHWMTMYEAAHTKLEAAEKLIAEANMAMLEDLNTMKLKFAEIAELPDKWREDCCVSIAMVKTAVEFKADELESILKDKDHE